MRILFLSDNFFPEVCASASRVYERACYWVKWGHEVTVITSTPNFPEGKVFNGYKNKWHQVEYIDGIRVVRVKTFIAPNKGFWLRIIDFLSYMFTSFFIGLFQKKADVIIATSPQFFTAVSGYFLAAIKRKPFVFELSDLWPESIVAVGAMKRSLAIKVLEKVELFLYKHAVAIISLTAAMKNNLLQRGIVPEKIFVIRNGVDLTRYEKIEKDLDLIKKYNLSNKFIIGYVGTHGPAQDLGQVIDAAQLLVKQSIHFIFVGAGAERQQLIERVNESHLSNVSFIPSQPKNKVNSFWSLCDLVLVPLKDDPLFETAIPSKIFEAMGMGLPILLVAPNGEARQIIEQTKSGRWIPAGKPNVLAKTIVQLYNDRNMLKEYVEAGLAAVPNHSREKQALDVLNVLQDVIKGQ